VWAAGPNFGSLYAGIEKVAAPDPRTVVFELSGPNTALPVLMSWSSSGIMPEDFGGRSKQEYLSAPIGAGAFAVSSWSPGGRIELDRNEHYYLPDRPYVDRVEIDVVADANERAVLFQSGQADVSEYVSPITAGQYGESVVALPASQIEHLSLNVSAAPFDDPDVRRAVAAAIDYQAIVKGPARGYGSAPRGILPPNLGHWAAPGQPPHTTDPDAARALLAGSTNPTPGPVELVYDSGQPLDELIAQIVQANLREIGLSVTLTGLETGAFLDRAFGLDADMVLWSYGAISPDMVDPIGWILGTSWLFTGYPTDTLDEQYAAYSAAESAQDKQRVVTQIQDESLEAAQAIPLAELQVLQGVRAGVNGFASAPWGLYYWDPIWLAG
jgi:peptide/nickel transport system substrate-binding protein